MSRSEQTHVEDIFSLLLQVFGLSAGNPSQRKVCHVTQAPKNHKALQIVLYASTWVATAVSAGMWNVRWMRVTIAVWILLYTYELALVFYPGWFMSSVYSKQDLVTHHTLSVFSALVSLLASYCEVGESIALIGGSWSLVNINEITMFLLDICGMSQKDSTLSLVRRLFLVVFCGAVSPCLTVRCLILFFGMLSSPCDWTCLLPCALCSLCAVLMQVAVYPRILYRSVSTLYQSCKSSGTSRSWKSS